MKKRLYTLIALLTLTGCVVEKYPDNGWCENYVVVKSFDADNTEITATRVVEKVSLYVFENDKFVRKIEGVVNQRIPIVNVKDSVRVVVWGNVENMTQNTEIVANEIFITLKNDGAIADTMLARSPSDMFFGAEYVKIRNVETVIPIKRKTASINITARNINATNDDKFEFVVNKTKNSLTFNAQLVGIDVSYKVNGTRQTNTEIITGAFRTFANNEPISIDVFKNGTKIYTAYTDKNGAPMFVADGRLLNVIIDFGDGEVVVTVEVMAWDDNMIDQEF